MAPQRPGSSPRPALAAAAEGYRQLLDVELHAVLRELGGLSPQRIERKHGE